MATYRRPSGLQKRRPFVEPVEPETSPIPAITSAVSTGVQTAQTYDKVMQKKLLETGIQNKKVQSSMDAGTKYDLVQLKPSEGSGWLRGKGGRTIINEELVGDLNTWELNNPGEFSKTSNPKLWEQQLLDSGLNENEVAKQFGFENATDFDAVKVKGESFKMTTPDGTEVNIRGEYWDPNTKFSDIGGVTDAYADMYNPDGSINLDNLNIDMAGSDIYADVPGSRNLYETDISGVYSDVPQSGDTAGANIDLAAETDKLGDVQRGAMEKYREFIHGPSGVEGWTPPGTEASISTVGETALTQSGELATHTASGTQLASGSKVMTLANGNTVPLAGKALAVEKATIASAKAGADAVTAAATGSKATVTAGAKIFGDVAAAHSAGAAAGATAAEMAALGAAAITPVGWTLIAVAIVATLVEADKRKKKKEKKSKRSRR
jgi:hypothetical protein